MGIPHKHSKLIKLWADGAKIQVWDTYTNTWACTDNPVWHLNKEYRIKPETIQYRISLHKNVNREAYTYSWNNPSYVKDIELTSETFVRWLTDWIEVEV